jgi:anti-sigma B factor antagonist
MDVTIARVERGDTVELVVGGRLDAETAGELARMVDEELRRGHHDIGLDLDAVGFLSSAGIRVLFEMHRAAKAAGGTCLIRTAAEPVRKVLELTRLAPILMQGATAAASSAGHRTAPVATLHAAGVSLLGLEPPTGGLRGMLVGGLDGAADSAARRAEKHALPRHTCGLGLGGIADDQPVDRRAGELVAACGAVFHRPPQPFAAVDYLVGTGDLVPAARFMRGVVWHGLPSGRAGFEPVADEPAVPLDALAAAALAQTAAPVAALVVAGEVQGLVGAELIRPLAEATPGDAPGSPDRDVAARWLSFSREPVHPRRTALVVGVICRGRPAGPLGEFVRPLGRGDLHGHIHAVVFPLRPLRRGAVELAATVADLAASEPLAVMHLLDDPEPVLGSGRSEFVRGGCWFAPLTVTETAAP